MLNITQPFRLNDTVSIGEIEGRIVESNWRATKLIDSLGNLVVVPNSAAARATIVNLSEPSGLHGVTLTLDVDPAVRPAVVVGALERAAASSLDVLARPAPVAVVKAFGTNAIRYGSSATSTRCRRRRPCATRCTISRIGIWPRQAPRGGRLRAPRRQRRRTGATGTIGVTCRAGCCCCVRWTCSRASTATISPRWPMRWSRVRSARAT